MKNIITLASIVIGLTGCGKEKPYDPNAELIAEIADLEKKYSAAQSRYLEMSSNWRSANARAEYDSIVRQGSAGASEMLILAQKN